MIDFLAAIVADLRLFSAAGLELGIAESQNVRVEGGAAGTAGPLLRTISRFTALVPELLRELEERAEGAAEDYPTHNPHRARLSNRVGDYEWLSIGPSPSLWLATELIPQAPVLPMRWLLHLGELLQAALGEAIVRHDQMAAQIAEARRGGLGWSLNDEPRLESRRRCLRAAQFAVDRLRGQISTVARSALQAIDRFPNPYPRGRAWEILRRLLPAIALPWGSPRDRARELLSDRADIPDLPFLYQRWCALRVHLELEAQGFEAHGDLVATLFGAGEIRYRRADAGLSMWIETRLVAGERHASGFTCVEGRELTPDIMLVTPGPRGNDAFVLDPTLSSADDRLIAKGSYLDRIAGFDLDLVAGVPTIRRSPLRAWAMAPFESPINRILDTAGRSGRVGAIPLHPTRPDMKPLRAFLADVVAQARAWQA